jgi:predicted PurR-regulated permease PerM
MVDSSSEPALIPPSASAESRPDQEPTHRQVGQSLEIDIGWPSLLLIGGMVAALVVAATLARLASDTVVHVVIALIGAFALDPVVRAVQRWTRLPRTGAVTTVVVAIVAVVGGVVTLLAPAVTEQVRHSGRDGPAVLADLTRLPVIGRILEKNHVPDEAQRWLEGLPDRITANIDQFAGVARDAALRAAGVLATLLLLVLFLIEGPDLVRLAGRALPPRWQRPASRMASSVYLVIGRYAVGSLVLAALAGTAAFLIGLGLAIPLVGLAALWVFLWNFVPELGGGVGGAGLVGLALTRGVGPALIALVAWVVYLQLAHRLVMPVVVGRAVHLSPLATMVVGLLGAAIAGLLGAVIAIPVVAAVKAARSELRSN